MKNNTNNINYRYVITIEFKLYTKRLDSTYNKVGKKVEHITQPVKSLKEAQEYRSLIDDTVKRAFVYDKVTQKICEWWQND